MTLARHSHPQTISPLDWSILTIVDRYRAITGQLIHLLLRSDISWDSLRLRLQLLCRKAWLRKTTLSDHQACFVLGVKAERVCRRHNHKHFPFGSHALLQHLGIAHLCAFAGYTRLHPEEFKEQFPDADRQGLPAHSYCLSLGPENELVWAIVDHATTASRFPQKVFKFVSKRRGQPGFETLIQETRLRVCVITATDEKRIRIEMALAEKPIQYLPTSVISIPYLTQFLL